MFGQAPYVNSVHSDDIVFHRQFDKQNYSKPLLKINAQNFYSNLNILTMKWAQSLNQRMSIIFDMIDCYL